MTVIAKEMKAEYDDPWEAVAKEREARKQAESRIDELEQTVNDQSEHIDELESELENQSNNISGAFAKVGSIDDRVSDLEEQEKTQDENSTSKGETSRKTPLEKIVNTPEHRVDQLGLSANQERSRNIARDAHEYGEKAPAGLVIDSSTIRKFHCSRDSLTHTETVSSVMDFLSDLGKDEVELVKRRGQRMVVFSEELANRMKAHRCDRDNALAPRQSVSS